VALEETILIEHDLKMSFIKYIADENHYKEVLSLVGKAKQMVWIGKFCKDCGRREYCADPIK
jgi:hypothetical protein